MADSLYREKYGSWVGNPQGHKPNFTLCCESVWSKERSPRHYQCTRKRGFGPDKAYCKQHDPEAAKARQEASQRKWDDDQRRYNFNGRTFFDALQKIADGHNDPRGLAQTVIAEFKAGER